jgi:thioredoxin-related protein
MSSFDSFQGVNMKKIVLILFFISTILIAKTTDTNQTIQTNNNFNIDKLSTQAKESNKHILIFFHKNYCGFCNNMEKSIHSKKINKKIKKDFIYLPLNIDDKKNISYQWFKGTTHQFAKEFGINLYPTLIFLNEKEAIYSIVGERKRDELLNILKFISTKSYKNMDFDTFKSNLEFEEDINETNR